MVQLGALDALGVLQGVRLEIGVLLAGVHVIEELAVLRHVLPVRLWWLSAQVLLDFLLLRVDLHVEELLEQDLLVGVGLLGDELLLVLLELLDGQVLRHVKVALVVTFASVDVLLAGGVEPLFLWRSLVIFPLYRVLTAFHG